VLNKLIAALQAKSGAGALTPPGAPGAAPAPGATASGGGAPAPGAPAPAAPAGGAAPQATATEKKAVSYTVTSTASGHTWTMLPGQDAQLKDDPKYSIAPKYADGTHGAALPKGQTAPPI
jgi:hypothetical protein